MYFLLLLSHSLSPLISPHTSMHLKLGPWCASVVAESLTVAVAFRAVRACGFHVGGRVTPAVVSSTCGGTSQKHTMVTTGVLSSMTQTFDLWCRVHISGHGNHGPHLVLFATTSTLAPTAIRYPTDRAVWWGHA